MDHPAGSVGGTLAPESPVLWNVQGETDRDSKAHVVVILSELLNYLTHWFIQHIINSVGHVSIHE